MKKVLKIIILLTSLATVGIAAGGIIYISNQSRNYNSSNSAPDDKPKPPINPLPPIQEWSIELKGNEFSLGNNNQLPSQVSVNEIKNIIINNKNNIFNIKNLNPNYDWNANVIISNLQPNDTDGKLVFDLQIKQSNHHHQVLNSIITFNGYKQNIVPPPIQEWSIELKGNEFSLGSNNQLPSQVSVNEIKNIIINNKNNIFNIKNLNPNYDWNANVIISNLQPNDIDGKLVFDLQIKQSNHHNQVLNSIITFNGYKQNIAPPQVSKVEQFIREINLANFKLKPLKQNQFISFVETNRLDLIQNYIEGFDYRDLVINHDIRVEIIDYYIDVLNYQIEFKIKLTDNVTDEQATSNTKIIKYLPVDQFVGNLDRITTPTDDDVKVKNSYKGRLEILDNLKYHSFNNINNNFENYMNKYKDHNWKIKEMLYQVRFIFYQSFLDNASSIDYGVIINNGYSVGVELKAKIKNDMQIAPYVQALGDENSNRTLTFNSGSVVSINLTTSNIKEAWNYANGQSILPGEGGWSLAQGNKDEILNNKRYDLTYANMKNMSLNIKLNNGSIINKNPVWRSFSFLFPYKNKR